VTIMLNLASRRSLLLLPYKPEVAGHGHPLWSVDLVLTILFFFSQYVGRKAASESGDLLAIRPAACSEEQKTLAAPRSHQLVLCQRHQSNDP
jgi:hypothetical protein